MAELGEELSDRELDVLRCLSSGASNKEIASELSISENTVKVHLRNIYTKLGVSSRTEATTAALQQGYIEMPGVEVEPASSAAEEHDVPPANESTPADVQAAAPPSAATGRERRGWRMPLLAVLLLASLIAVVLLSLELMNGTMTAQTTPEPFQETAVADTRWLVSRPMPQPRAGMAVAALGLDVYQIGGETDAGVDGTVNVFDSRERTWRTAAAKPTAVADAHAAELYGEIYVPGGRLADGSVTAVVEAYSPSQDAWRPVAALPEPLAGALTLSDGAFLYVFGGWTGEDYLDTAYVYDPGLDSWRPLPPLPEPRAFVAGGLLTNQFYIVGGTDGTEESGACFTFDPIVEAWSSCPDMLQPRAGAGATVLLNKLYVIGGGLDPENEITFSEVYDPSSETWQVVNSPMLTESTNWPYVGVTHIETRIFAQGGREGDTLLADNMIYAPLVYQTFIPAASSGEEE